MSHIFISYSYKDKAYVHRLHRALIDKGFDAWIDDRIDYGSRWPREIEKRLQDCSAFILVMSPASNESDWVQNELHTARRLKKPIFPLLLEGEVWWHLQTTQFVDVTGGKPPPANFYVDLGKAVARHETHAEHLRDSAEKPKNDAPSIHIEGDANGSTIIIGDQNVVKSGGVGRGSPDLRPTPIDPVKRGFPDLRLMRTDPRSWPAKPSRAWNPKIIATLIGVAAIIFFALFNLSLMIGRLQSVFAPTLTFTPTFTPEVTASATFRPPEITEQAFPATVTSRPLEVTEQTFLATVTPSPSPKNPVSVATVIGGGTGEIAFASVQNDTSQIYLINADGSNLRTLTNEINGACQPAWSPDGKKLVYVSPCLGKNDQYTKSSLFVLDLDSGQSTGLSTVSGGDFEPAWSPDGAKIAFSSLREGFLAIYVLNLADKAITRLTALGTLSNPLQSRQPAWSPDSSQIVYAVRRFTLLQIWVMASDGSNQAQLLHTGGSFSDYLPVFSPGGSFVLFSETNSQATSPSSLMRFTLNSDKLPQIVPISLPVVDADFSPDGQWIAYETSDTKNQDIYICNLADNSRQRLTTDSAVDFDPAWRP